MQFRAGPAPELRPGASTDRGYHLVKGYDGLAARIALGAPLLGLLLLLGSILMPR